MPSPVTCLLIPADPHKPARNLTIDQDTPGAFQQLVGGYLEGVGIGGTWHAYCDEEGKLHRKPVNFRATRLARLLGWDRAHRDVLVGDVVFTGNGPDGTEADVPNIVLGQWALMEAGPQ